MTKDTLTIAQALMNDGDPHVSWGVSSAGGSPDHLWQSLAIAIDYCEDYGDRITLWRAYAKPSAAELYGDLMDTVREWSADDDSQWSFAAIRNEYGDPEGCTLDDCDAFTDALYFAAVEALRKFDPKTAMRHETPAFITFTPELEAAVLEADKIRMERERQQLEREFNDYGEGGSDDGNDYGDDQGTRYEPAGGGAP